MKLKSILLEGVKYIASDRLQNQSTCLSCDLYDYCHPNNYTSRGPKLLVICCIFGQGIYFKKDEKRWNG